MRRRKLKTHERLRIARIVEHIARIADLANNTIHKIVEIAKKSSLFSRKGEILTGLRPEQIAGLEFRPAGEYKKPDRTLLPLLRS